MKNLFVNIVVLVVIVSVSGCHCQRKNTGSKKEMSSAVAITQSDTFTLKETHWKLIELKGQSIVNPVPYESEAYIILNANDSTLNGSGGCNSIFGTYELKENNLISFSHIGMTKMACTGGMIIESELVEALRQTNFYVLGDKTLILYKAVKVPLAKFEAKKDGPVK